MHAVPILVELVDLVLVRILDIFLAFPGILLAIALAGMMGPGIENVVIALAMVGWVGYARLARAQVLSLKEQDHVVAAMAIGAKPIAIITRHLLPLTMAPLIVEASFGIAGTVIAEAGLSFLGLGVQPPVGLVGEYDSGWNAIYVGGTPHGNRTRIDALMAVVLAINILGDWLRDWLDVKAGTRQE